MAVNSPSLPSGRSFAEKVCPSCMVYSPCLGSILNDGRPGLAVIADASGPVILASAFFHAAMLIDGFHLKRRCKWSKRPASFASSCSLSPSTVRLISPVILIVYPSGSAVSVPSMFSATPMRLAISSSSSRRRLVASASACLAPSHACAYSDRLLLTFSLSFDLGDDVGQVWGLPHFELARAVFCAPKAIACGLQCTLHVAIGVALYAHGQNFVEEKAKPLRQLFAGHAWPVQNASLLVLILLKLCAHVDVTLWQVTECPDHLCHRIVGFSVGCASVLVGLLFVAEADFGNFADAVQRHALKVLGLVAFSQPLIGFVQHLHAADLDIRNVGVLQRKQAAFG